MPAIPPSIVEATWRRYSEASIERLLGEAERARRRQPHLLAFMTAAVEEAGPDAAELAAYLFYSILAMFEQAAGGRLPVIPAATIHARCAHNEETFSRLESAHPRFVARATDVATSRQPHVLRFVVEVIFEWSRAQETTGLDEAACAFLFFIFKTVVDVLDEALPARPRKRRR